MNLNNVNPADVDAITMSLGVPLGNEALLAAFQPFFAAGVASFFAAGNDAGPYPLYPGAYSSLFPNVMSVSSVGSFDPLTREYFGLDHLSLFLSEGPTFAPFGGANAGADIVAVGVGEFAHFTPTAYQAAYTSGTSHSTPQAAGVYASLLSIVTAGAANQFPALNAMTKSERSAAIVAAMKAGAQDLDPLGFDGETGWGHVDGRGALQELRLAEQPAWFENPLQRVSGMRNNVPAFASGFHAEVLQRMTSATFSTFEINFSDSSGSCWEGLGSYEVGEPEVSLPVQQYTYAESVVPSPLANPPALQNPVNRSDQSYELTGEIEVPLTVYWIPILSCIGIGKTDYEIEGHYRPETQGLGVTQLRTWHQIDSGDRYRILSFEQTVPEMETVWDVDGFLGNVVLEAIMDEVGDMLDLVDPILDAVIAPALRQEGRNFANDMMSAHRVFDPAEPTRAFHIRSGPTFPGFVADSVPLFAPAAELRHDAALPPTQAPHEAVTQVPHRFTPFTDPSLPAFIRANFPPTFVPAQANDDFDWQSTITSNVRRWELNVRDAQGLWYSPQERFSTTTPYSTDVVMEFRDLDKLDERVELTLWATPDSDGNWGIIRSRHRARWSTCSVRADANNAPNPVPERIGPDALRGQREPCDPGINPAHVTNDWSEIRWTQTIYLSGKEVHRARGRYAEEGGAGSPETYDARVAFERRAHPYTDRIDIDITGHQFCEPACPGPFPSDPLALHVIGVSEDEIKIALRELYARRVGARLIQSLSDEYWTPYFDAGVQRMTISPVLGFIENFLPDLIEDVDVTGMDLSLADVEAAKSAVDYTLVPGPAAGDAPAIRTKVNRMFDPSGGGPASAPIPPSVTPGVFHGSYFVDLAPVGYPTPVERFFSYIVVSYVPGNFDHTESRNYTYVTKYEGPAGAGEHQPTAVFYISDLGAFERAGLADPANPGGIIPEFNPAVGHKKVFVPRRDVTPDAYATRQCQVTPPPPGSLPPGSPFEYFSCLVGLERDALGVDHAYYVVPWNRNRFNLGRPKECLSEHQLRLNYYRHNAIWTGFDGLYYTFDPGEVNPSYSISPLVRDYRFTPVTLDFDSSQRTTCDGAVPPMIIGAVGHYSGSPWGGGGEPGAVDAVSAHPD